MNIPLEILGLLAGFITNVSYFPQLWRTWRTKKVRDISLPFTIMITIGLTLWLIYGMIHGGLALIVANSTGVMMTGALMIMKIVFGRRH